MKLRARFLDMCTESALVVLINHETAHQEDLRAGDRVVLTANGNRVVATINTTHSNNLIGKNEIGLYTDTATMLGAIPGTVTNIVAEPRADSIKHIRKKMDGKTLSPEDIQAIVRDIVDRNLTDVELTYFVAATSIRPLAFSEVIALTRSMAETGTRMHFNNPIVVDKHCIGGVPGNRTSIISIPIMASLGCVIPKTSSRAITSPAGTADTMEVFARVDLSAEQVKQAVLTTGACIVWGDAVKLAPANDRIIRIERPLSIDVSELLLASVMAKKYSIGSTHILIDIPYGPNAKVETIERAQELQEQFEAIGKELGLKLLVLLTDGSQPIGNGVGPLLEAYDVLAVLKNDPAAPNDLREKALILSGTMLEFVGMAAPGTGRLMAEHALESGKAYKKFEQIMQTQGKHELPPLAKYKQHILATNTGIIRQINNSRIARIARIAGAPSTPNAGLLLYPKVGSGVHAGEPLFTIFAESDEKLQQAVQHAAANDPFIIDDKRT